MVKGSPFASYSAAHKSLGLNPSSNTCNRYLDTDRLYKNKYIFSSKPIDSMSKVYKIIDNIHKLIMRDVNNGWLIRYLHSNTASAFFFIVYLHIGRGLYYGSYRAPRTLVWTIGTVIFILMIATAFLGYKRSPKWFKSNDNTSFSR